MAASGCDRKAPAVWGQSLRSSDARARKAAEIPTDPKIEDASEKPDSWQCQSLWQRNTEKSVDDDQRNIKIFHCNIILEWNW